MVWFQCEDCTENLKKPKVPNHFRICSASKFSCIDCGQTFGRRDVEGHTQCITEAEKYGPKGQGKATTGSTSKPNNASNQKPEIDINVGLSEGAPWFCSLCNTKATSKQTLLLHAEGKKHRAKARAFHAAKQQPKESEGAITGISGEHGEKKENPEHKTVEERKVQKPSDVDTRHDSSLAENGDLLSSKKRKLEVSENGGTRQKSRVDTTTELGHGEVIQVEGPGTEVRKGLKGTEQTESKYLAVVDSTSKKESDKNEKKIKWKKLIISALKSNPDGVLKFKKLTKLVFKSLKESGFSADEKYASQMLEQKINSSSRFEMKGKCVHLATKS